MPGQTSPDRAMEDMSMPADKEQPADVPEGTSHIPTLQLSQCDNLPFTSARTKRPRASTGSEADFRHKPQDQSNDSARSPSTRKPATKRTKVTRMEVDPPETYNTRGKVRRRVEIVLPSPSSMAKSATPAVPIEEVEMEDSREAGSEHEDGDRSEEAGDDLSENGDDSEHEDNEDYRRKQ